MRLRIVLAELQKIALVHGDLVPQTQEEREGEPDALRTIDEGVAERSRLAQESHASRWRHPIGEGGIHANPRPDDAEGIRTDEMHVIALHRPAQILFHRSPVHADLPEAGTDDHERRNTFLPALLRELLHGDRRRHDDDKIHRPVDGGNSRIDLFSENGSALGIHGIDLPGIPLRDQIPENHVSDFVFVRGCADHGDRLRGEKRHRSAL
jgi:hypothetical protein